MDEILHTIHRLKQLIRKKYGLPHDMNLELSNIAMWVKEKEGVNHE